MFVQEIISKTEETIDIIDNSDIIKRLRELKKIINDDSTIQQLMTDFNNAKKETDNISNIKQTKERFYNHPVITEYRKLYSTLNISLLKFNKELSSLLNVKNPTCGRI